jgi:hypothetical protein
LHKYLPLEVLEKQHRAMTATETATIANPPVFETVIPDYFDSKRRPSLFVGEPKTKQLGELGVQSSFVNQQGLRIASYYWPVIPKHMSVRFL